MEWLTSRPTWLLLAGCLALAALVAVASRVAVRALVPADDHDRVREIAAPLMPALGALFAVMIAITLSSEAGYLKSAQDVVSSEAAAASRLAWAATTPGVQTTEIQAALREYLQTARVNEWRGAAAAGGDAATERAVAALEQVVRAQAARSEIGTPASTELLASLDAVTSARRARVAAASRQIPVLYVVTLVASGIALIANAGALVFRSTARASLLILGLATVVGLSIAVLLALVAPWDGPLIVSGHSIDSIAEDLRAGVFRS